MSDGGSNTLDEDDLGLGYNIQGFMTFYNVIAAERGFSFPPHLIPIGRALVDRRIDKLLGIIGPGSGKSTAISEIYPAFELGHDPTQTILGISAGEALMQGFQRSVMETIEWSPAFRAMFPKVRPDKDAGWSSERGMFVTGREIGNPDASFAATGLDSKRLTGLHARIIDCDDIHDDQNSTTTEQCDKVWTRWHNTVLGRADPRGARYIVTGRRWSRDDIYSRLMLTGEFVVIELPGLRENNKELWVDVTVPDGIICCFNETDTAFGETTDIKVSDKAPVKIIRKRIKPSDVPLGNEASVSPRSEASNPSIESWATFKPLPLRPRTRELA